MVLKRTAVIITCHNRKEFTYNCIKCLYACDNNYCRIDVYLTDDGCTDGTAELIKKSFPKVKIIRGNGKLFWVGGMNLAWREASKLNYDFYLWLNDDTFLYKDALKKLFDAYYYSISLDNTAVIVGSTIDPKTNEISYGGYVHASIFRKMRFKRVMPSNKPMECHTMNGNCVLIPKDIFLKAGFLDSKFTHFYADFDYGLTVTEKLKKKIYICKGFVGVCEVNEDYNNIYTSKMTIFSRLKFLFHSKKGNIFNEWLYFGFKHYSLYGFLLALFYARIILFPIRTKKLNISLR